MTPILRFPGWFALATYGAVLVLANLFIVIDLYRLPEGPWPGWTPLITADLLYGGGGAAVATAVRWMWHRHARRRSFHVHG